MGDLFRRLRSVSLLSFAVLVATAMPLFANEPVLLEDGSLTARSIQLIVLVSLLSLAPAILISVTCFPFMVTVLSILRMSIGLQQSPPNMLIVSLALFLTWFVMDPVFAEAWASAVAPYLDGQLAIEEALAGAYEPFRAFMELRVSATTLEVMQQIAPPNGIAGDGVGDIASRPAVLIPSFLLSELSKAFEIGFLVFLPFMLIDLVVASILMAMGMMMVPPAMVALPFKLAFFVIADGWSLLAGALVNGYAL